MGLREEKKRETRHAILGTALALFREQGFEGTRIQDVADRLRISEGTFFNYFPTKHSVLEAVGGELIDAAIERLERDVVREGRPVPEVLDELVRAFARGFSGDREFAALLATHTSFFSGARSERLHASHRMLADLFANGQQRGEIRADIPPAHLADAFMAVCMTMVHGWVGEPSTPESLEDRLVAAASVVILGCAVVGST